MTAVLAAAWHDAAHGFTRAHGHPGFWIACTVLAVVIITWRRTEA